MTLWLLRRVPLKQRNAILPALAEFSHNLKISIISHGPQPSLARKVALKGARVHGRAVGIM